MSPWNAGSLPTMVVPSLGRSAGLDQHRGVRMSGMSRRAFFLATGAMVALSETLFGVGASHAMTSKREDEGADDFVARCTQIEGGEVRYSSTTGKPDYCANTNADKQCEAEHGEEWYFSESEGKCDEGCFLTTACVAHAGLDDRCFELQALREFRDDTLIFLPGGADDIAAYYAKAPTIVSRILTSPQPAREFARLYALYIFPSAVAARLGLRGLTRRIYSRMMADLSARCSI